MTGLDGAAWLNLFGLFLLWAIYWTVDQFRDTPGYERLLHHATVAIACFFVIADARQWLPEEPNPLLQAMAALLLAVASWELLGGFVLLLFETLTAEASEQTAATSAGRANTVGVADLRPPPADEGQQVDRDGYLDLDAGTPHSAENRARMTGAIGELMGPRASSADRLRAFGTLFGDDDPDEDSDEAEGSDLAYLTISFLLMAAVLGSPCWIAWRLLA